MATMKVGTAAPQRPDRSIWLEGISLGVALCIGALFWTVPTLLLGHLLSGMGGIVNRVGMSFWIVLYLVVIFDAYVTLRGARALTRLSSRERADYLDTAWAAAQKLLASLCIFAAAWLFAWQILHWLKEGQWAALDFVTLGNISQGLPIGPQIVFNELFSWKSSTWLAAPQSWTGLHSVVTFVLSWIGPPFVAVVIACVLLLLNDECIQRRRGLELRNLEYRS